MKITKIVAAAWLLCLPKLIVAQTDIHGQVTDIYTHNVLEGAVVSGDGGHKALTDSLGRFAVSCADRVTVSYVGYASRSVEVRDCSTPLRVELKRAELTLDPVNVFGRENPTRPDLEEPKAMVSLGSREINRGTGLYLDDAINRSAPGVAMSRRGVSSGQQFNIRGFGNGVGFKGANNNFDTRGTKVYLDGIPLTDAQGVTVLDDIDFASLDEVSIIKGPAGAKYGFAIAGVVSLQTAQPTPGHTSIGQKVLVGDYGLRRYTTTLQTGGLHSSMLVNYGRQLSDGYQPHTQSTKDFVNFVGRYSPSNKQHTSVFFGYGNSYDQRAGELTIDQFEAGDYSGNERYIKNDAHSEVVGFRAGLANNYVFSPHLANKTTLFGGGRTMNASSAGGWSEDQPLNYGFRSAFQFDFSLKGNLALRGEAGIEMQAGKSHPLFYSMAPDSNNLGGYNVPADIRSNQVAETRNATYFTEWTLGLPSDLSFTAGVGISGMHIRLEDREYAYASPGQRLYEAQYTNLVSPHLTVNKVIGDHLSAYIDYSRAYRPPVSSNITIGYTGELNTGLVPEKGTQLEIGSKGDLAEGKFTWQLAYFHTGFTQKFTSVAVSLDSLTTAYSYLVNGGGQLSQGVEFQSSWLVYKSDVSTLSRLGVWGNFTYSHFKYRHFTYESVGRNDHAVHSQTYDGNPVAGVSPFTANLGMDIETKPGVFGNINYNFRDGMPITSDGQFNTDALHLVNGKVGYRTGAADHWWVELYVGANNLTGSQNYIMVFVNQLPDAYIPAPDKADIFAGLNVRYTL